MKESIACIFSLLWLGVFPTLGQEIIHLGREVNSIYDEREPRISPDGNTLFFWRRVSPLNTGGLDDFGDIWYSEKQPGGRWAEARRMPPPFNTPGHDFVWQVQTDTLWLTQVPKGSRVPGVAYATRNRFGGWTPPRKVRVDQLQSTGPCKDFFLASGRVMLLPNDGADSYGGCDLYVAFPLNDTAWTRPVNLGRTINTPGDEDAPYLSPDGKTLFFNSNGHGGLGNHDIYVSHRLSDSWQDWSPPENLGAPINSEAYDFDFTLSPDGKLAYWGSEAGTYGRGDIFFMNLDQCQVDVYPEGDQVMCEGDTLTLQGGYFYASQVDYQWLKDGRILPGATGRTLKIVAPGAYQLVRRTPICRDTSAAKHVQVQARPQVGITAPDHLVCEGDSMMLWAGRQPGFSYRWEKDGIPLPGERGPGLWISGSGSYQVAVSNEACETLSAPFGVEALATPEVMQAGDILPNSTHSLPKWLWSNRLKSPKGNTYLKDITLDQRGNIFALTVSERKGEYKEYLTHLFEDGPLGGQYLLHADLKDASDRYLVADPDGNLITTSNDHYLVKYSPRGQRIWQMSHRGGSQVMGLAVDRRGFIYTAGRFSQNISIDGKVLSPAAHGSVYLAKHSPSGRTVWLRSFAIDGRGAPLGNRLHVDQQGNVYLAGQFEFLADFETQAQRATLTQGNFFLLKLAQDGSYAWSRKVTLDQEMPESGDVYTDPEGRTTILLDRHLFRFRTGGELIQDDRIDFPEQVENLQVVSYMDNLYFMGLGRSSDEYTVMRQFDWGKPVVLWKGGKPGRKSSSVPVLAIGNRGELIVGGGIQKGEVPGKNLSPGQPSSQFIAKYAKPGLRNDNKPLLICGSEEAHMLTEQVRGMTYQWYKNGQEIPGATHFAYSTAEPGAYQVEIRGASCQSRSGVREVRIDCDEDKRVARPILTASPAPPQPESDPAPTPAPVPPPGPVYQDAPELARGSDGKPVSLSDRPLDNQADITVRSRTVDLYIWDSELFDQDTVSLNINGEWVLEDYELLPTRKKITYTFPPNSSVNFIILYADNLGTKPPNTASLMVDDGYRTRTIRLRSTLEDCGTLTIQTPH